MTYMYMSLCVVMTDWGNLRDEIFSRTGFAPSAFIPHLHTPTSPRRPFSMARGHGSSVVPVLRTPWRA